VEPSKDAAEKSETFAPAKRTLGSLVKRPSFVLNGGTDGLLRPEWREGCRLDRYELKRSSKDAPLLVYQGLRIVVAEGALRSAPKSRVAVKKETKEFISDKKDLQRTREQADVLRKLAHEHIVPVVEAYEDEAAFYLVMPFAIGGSLFSKVRNKTLTEFETRNFTSQALSALEHVHNLGFVHTDVKPHNFLLHPVEGRFHVWLCDFGFADPVRADGSVAFTILRGTFGYFAPEMIKQLDYGPAVDIFALGVTVHSLLVGYAAFDPPSHFEELDFDPRYWKHMSNASREIVAGMLDLDPETRLTAAAAAEHEWFSADVKEEQKVEKYVPAPDARLKFHAAGSVPPLEGMADLLVRPKDHLANPNEPEDLTVPPRQENRSPASPGIKTVATAPGQLTRLDGPIHYDPPVRSASSNKLADQGYSRVHKRVESEAAAAAN
jgi:serine/threonine protein kinase